jgi:hypothetical protein
MVSEIFMLASSIIIQKKFPVGALSALFKPTQSDHLHLSCIDLN